MSGCNNDRIKDDPWNSKLKSAQKKKYKNLGIWLSSGTNDKTATPQQHKDVAKSMKDYGMKNVQVHSFKGGHIIHQDDQIPALNWMLSLKDKK